MFDSKPTYERHPDDEWYDEVRIFVLPRYKTSGLSGDEWRVSAKIQIFRKGVLLKERGMSKMQYAAAVLPATILEMCDEPTADDARKATEKLCFQAGCKEPGVVEYRLKDEYYHSEGEKKPKREWRQDVRRRFCERHATRGDCGLEDADQNYELISAPQGMAEKAAAGIAEAESPSAVATIEVTSIDELPAAIEAIRKSKNK